MTTQQSAPKVAHTQWRVKPLFGRTRQVYHFEKSDEACEVQIATIFPTERVRGSSEWIGDTDALARLIAAAPDLLAALRRIDSGLMQILHDADRALESCAAKRGGTLEKINEIGKRAKFERDQIRAAIAKATS